MLSIFDISGLDLGLIMGGGFAVVGIIMGIIAYASMQTMKSVKEQNHWKELAFWGNKKGNPYRMNPPMPLSPMASRLSLLAPSSSAQFRQLSGLESAPITPMTANAPLSSHKESPKTPKQELMAWNSPNPVMPTLYNDFADPDPADSTPSGSKLQPLPLAPPPFEDAVERKPTRAPKLPRQEFRIVLPDLEKTTSNKQARQVRQRRTTKKEGREPKKEETKTLIAQEEQEIKEHKVPAPAALPISLPAIEKAITSPPVFSIPTDEEIETPIISKGNIRSLMNKSRGISDR
jgi:hypothetical protein